MGSDLVAAGKEERAAKHGRHVTTVFLPLRSLGRTSACGGVFFFFFFFFFFARRRRRDGPRVGRRRSVRCAPAGEIDADAAADRLIALMTDPSCWGCSTATPPGGPWRSSPCCSAGGPFVAGAVPRLGIPGIRFSDGARGVVIGASTAFPVTMARAATWDPSLEHEVGVAIGLETRGAGRELLRLGLREPAPAPRMGSRAGVLRRGSRAHRRGWAPRMTRGLRANVMACVKHFALNSMENERFEVDVSVDDHALHEVYLPHFKAAVDAGADSLMTAYNKVRGEYMDVNRAAAHRRAARRVGLLGVRDERLGVRHARRGRQPRGGHGRGDAAAAAARARAAGAALRRARWRARPCCGPRAASCAPACCTPRRTARPGRAASVIASPAHRALARRVAQESTVLLQNDAVGGGAAAAARPGASGTSRSSAGSRLGRTSATTARRGSGLPSTVSPLQGLREALPGVRITAVTGPGRARGRRGGGRGGDRRSSSSASTSTTRASPSSPAAWRSACSAGRSARAPSARLLRGVAHLAARFVRGGDRGSLELRPADVRLVRAVAAANPRTVVVLDRRQRDPDGGVAAAACPRSSRLVRRHGGGPRARGRAHRARRSRPDGCRSSCPPDVAGTCRRSTARRRPSSTTTAGGSAGSTPTGTSPRSRSGSAWATRRSSTGSSATASTTPAAAPRCG